MPAAKALGLQILAGSLEPLLDSVISTKISGQRYGIQKLIANLTILLDCGVSFFYFPIMVTKKIPI